jgi:hypothetical protein
MRFRIKLFFISLRMPDPDPGSQTNADPDPDPGQTLKPQKVEFLHENVRDVIAFLKGEKPGLFVKFSQFPCSWIRICIPNTDPDTRQPDQCRSGSWSDLKSQ